MSGWAWVFMGIAGVLFWTALIVGIVMVLRHVGSNGTGYRNPAGPEEVLAQRFARGEIDEQEYRHRLDVLHSPAAGPRLTKT